VSDEEIARLVAELDADDTSVAEDARAGLEAIGPAALEPLMAAIPRLGRFGQLSAIEVFEALGDPRAGEALVPMLESEHDTVRDWAAGALGRLGVDWAVPALRDAYVASQRRGTPLDRTEPTSIRRALTELRARNEIIPPRAEALAVDAMPLCPAWRPGDLVTVLDALVAARQVPLYYSSWRACEGGHTWAGADDAWSIGEMDWEAPWDDLVAASHAAARSAAEHTDLPPDAVVTLEWVDEGDR
jgi:hypothetical protein